MIINVEFTEDENQGDYIEIKKSDHMDMGELFQTFKEIALAMGFHPTTVADYFDKE